MDPVEKKRKQGIGITVFCNTSRIGYFLLDPEEATIGKKRERSMMTVTHVGPARATCSHVVAKKSLFANRVDSKKIN